MPTFCYLFLFSLTHKRTTSHLQKKKKTVLSEQAALEQEASEGADRAEQDAASTAPLVADAERSLEAAEKELREARERLAEAAGGRKRRIEAVRAALSLYERCLGLRFVMPQAAEVTTTASTSATEGGEGETSTSSSTTTTPTETEQQRREREEELKIVFTQVDPSDPEREFTLGLHLEGAHTYSVVRCDPHAALSAARRLCDALNSCPEDFAWFVREVRAEFRACAADEASVVGRLGV